MGQNQSQPKEKTQYCFLKKMHFFVSFDVSL